MCCRTRSDIQMDKIRMLQVFYLDICMLHVLQLVYRYVESISYKCLNHFRCMLLKCLMLQH